MRRTAVLLGLVLAGAGAAQASPPGGPGTVSPPYGAPFSNARDTCLTGATCTGDSAAEEDGAVSAASHYTRETAVDGREFRLDEAGYRVRHRTAPSSSKVTVTFRWLVSAATSADGSSGDVFATALLYTGSSGCGKGCTVTADTQVVAYSLSRGGLPWLSSYPSEVSGQQVDVTVVYSGKVPNWVEPRTVAQTNAVGYPANSCFAEGLPTCDVDSGHAGTADAHLEARLLSVVFEEA